MNTQKLYKLAISLIIMTSLISACGGATPAPSTSMPATEKPATAEPVGETQAVEPAPTDLRVAAVLTISIEGSWERSMIESYKRVQAASPHGLKIHDLDYTENVWGDEALVAMRQYAATGNYDIIWANSSYADQVKVLMDEFPDILFVYVGSGGYPLGRNAYWYFNHIHECGYLQGMLAGYLTESDVIGVVGTFPADDVNDIVNAFINGAKAVNPDVKKKITYIESWYDPPKAKEAAYAQIAAGVDQMYMMAESFEPCEEKGITCYAKYIDYNFAAPNSILSSAIMYWEPGLNWIIDEWWNHKTTGQPYNAPMEAVWYNMAQGVCALSPYHDLEGTVPQDVKDAILQAQQDIINGTLKVILDMKTPLSD